MDPSLPLALYIHIPWCEKKCPYCDFNSHEHFDPALEESYVDALLADLEAELPLIWGRRVSSIFIGGGTPSLFSAKAYDRLLSSIRALLPMHQPIEITLEANPGTVEAAKFNDYFALGINRLSIGIQSFNDEQLSHLGRIHDSRQALRAVEQAKTAGFTRLNIDLMHGLPGQSVTAAMADLQQAMALGVSHLSWYQLTIEANTAFAHQPPVLPKDETLATIQEQGLQLLAEHGFEQYEVSAFCQMQHYARHNINYWQFGDYLGIGAGAHGKITNPADNSITRKHKQRHPKAYLDPAKPFIAGSKCIPRKELPLEFMMNALRLKAGVPSEFFYSRTGLHLDSIRTQVADARARGLLTKNFAQLQATELGYRYLNELVEMFMIDDDQNFKTIIPIQSV